MDTIKTLHSKAKKALGSFYTPLLSFIALFLWTILSRNLVNIFYKGYLSHFGIKANYPITGTILHSKLILFFLVDAILAFIGVSTYLVYHYLSKAMESNHKIKNSLKILGCWFVLSLIILSSIGIFLIYINKEMYSPLLILFACVQPNFLIIYAIISAYIIVAFFVINFISPSKSNVDDEKLQLNVYRFHKNKLNKKNYLITLIGCFFLIVIGIFLIDNFFSSLGDSAASFEIAYPGFKEKDKTYIIIATMPDNKYLLIERDTINNKPICKIKDISDIPLKEIKLKP